MVVLRGLKSIISEVPLYSAGLLNANTTVRAHRRVSPSYETAPPYDPTVDLGPYESPGGGCSPYEQGTPVTRAGLAPLKSSGQSDY